MKPHQISPVAPWVPVPELPALPSRCHIQPEDTNKRPFPRVPAQRVQEPLLELEAAGPAGTVQDTAQEPWPGDCGQDTGDTAGPSEPITTCLKLRDFFLAFKTIF